MGVIMGLAALTYRYAILKSVTHIRTGLPVNPLAGNFQKIDNCHSQLTTVIVS